jgi:GTPase SAR1 family protein
VLLFALWIVKDDRELTCLQLVCQERFKGMNMGYLKGATAAIVVYDVNEGGSFTESQWWLQQLQRMSDMDKMVIALVGNKVDMLGEERKIEQKAVDEVVAEHNKSDLNNMFSIEVSAKTGENVGDLAKILASKMVALKESGASKTE